MTGNHPPGAAAPRYTIRTEIVPLPDEEIRSAIPTAGAWLAREALDLAAQHSTAGWIVEDLKFDVRFDQSAPYAGDVVRLATRRLRLMRTVTNAARRGEIDRAIDALGVIAGSLANPLAVDRHRVEQIRLYNLQETVQWTTPATAVAVAPAVQHTRARGAGRPKAHPARRSSAASGDSGSDDGPSGPCSRPHPLVGGAA